MIQTWYRCLMQLVEEFNRLNGIVKSGKTAILQLLINELLLEQHHIEKKLSQ